jgi:outer membrane protein OmpA-like peptidoglycan-associated protein
MIKRLMLTAAASAFLSAIPAAYAAPDPRYVTEAEKDAPGAADLALSRRYQGSFILGQTVKAFDELDLVAGPAEGKSWDSGKKFSKLIPSQGKVTRTAYLTPLNRSSLEVIQNFKNELSGKGFSPVFECAKEACGESFSVLKYRWDNKAAQPVGPNYTQIRQLLLNAVFDQVLDLRYALMKKSGPEGDTYVALYAGVNTGGGHGSFSDVVRDRASILVEAVEPKGMETRMETVAAEKIAGDLSAQGRAVFYGIFFDFDKAAVKPESAPQLAEMAKAMKAEPKMKVYIVGHSDNKGTLDYNLALSQRRAEAVVQALSGSYGIPAARMTAKGAGPLAPLASNKDELGQAKNRRVEMVAQ